MTPLEWATVALAGVGFRAAFVIGRNLGREAGYLEGRRWARLEASARAQAKPGEHR